MRVVFLGSPEFAVASLEQLLKSKHQVVGVITQPDRPAGRGLNLSACAVKDVAQAHGLDIFQPEKINTSECLAWLQAKNPDILAVVAFGQFLGNKLLGTGRFPPVNVHPSLLPDLRGAAPMQWALLRGYKKSGVSTQFMTKEMDAGDLLLQENCEIGINENAQELQTRLKEVGGRLLVTTLDGLEAGQLKPQPQDPTRVTFAPLLSKEQGLIRWSQCDATTIHNLVRGLYPWPSAYTFWQEKRCKILSSLVPSAQDAPQKKLNPGEFSFYGDALFVATASGYLQVLSLQPEAKRVLLPRDFANGINKTESSFHFSEGENS